MTLTKNIVLNISIFKMSSNSNKMHVLKKVIIFFMNDSVEIIETNCFTTILILSLFFSTVKHLQHITL